MVLPGGKIPDEAGTSTTTSPSSSQTAAPAEAHTQIKLSSGAIVGIIVGGVFIAILVGASLFFLGRQTTMLQFMRRQQQHQQQQLPPPMAYPVGGSPIPYHEPNTPMTQNSYVVGPYAYPNYSSRENVVELGSESSTIQHIHDGGQKYGMYSDQFDEYRRQEVTGSPLPSPPPPPRPATHLEFPE